MSVMDEKLLVEVQRRLTITDHFLDDVDFQKHCPLHLDSSTATRERDGLSTTWTRSKEGGGEAWSASLAARGNPHRRPARP